MATMRIISFTITALIAWSSSATGHILLQDPQPRNNNDGIKSGPCGGVPRTDTPAVFSPGETITVSWLETIDHPGYYRVAFSSADDQGFDDNVLLDDITDEVCTSAPCPYSVEVTLPDQPCAACTLQLIQFMGTGPTYSPYFSCADVVLEGDPIIDPDPPGDQDGGCQASGGPSGWLVGLLCALIAGVMFRRRTGETRQTRQT